MQTDYDEIHQTGGEDSYLQPVWKEVKLEITPNGGPLVVLDLKREACCILLQGVRC